MSVQVHTRQGKTVQVSSVWQRFLSVQDVVQSPEQQEFYVPGHDRFTSTTTTGRRRQHTQAQNDHRLFHQLYIELAVNLLNI